MQDPRPQDALLEQLVANESKPCLIETGGARCLEHGQDLIGWPTPECPVSAARKVLGLSWGAEPESYPETIPEGYADRPHLWSTEEGRWVGFVQPDPYDHPDVWVDERTLTPEPEPEPVPPAAPAGPPDVVYLPEMGIAVSGGRAYHLVPGPRPGSLTIGDPVPDPPHADELREVLQSVLVWQQNPADPAAVSRLRRAAAGWTATRGA